MSGDEPKKYPEGWDPAWGRPPQNWRSDWTPTRRLRRQKVEAAKLEAAAALASRVVAASEVPLPPPGELRTRHLRNLDTLALSAAVDPQTRMGCSKGILADLAAAADPLAEFIRTLGDEEAALAWMLRKAVEGLWSLLAERGKPLAWILSEVDQLRARLAARAAPGGKLGEGSE